MWRNIEIGKVHVSKRLLMCRVACEKDCRLMSCFLGTLEEMRSAFTFLSTTSFSLDSHTSSEHLQRFGAYTKLSYRPEQPGLKPS